ncbi:MAG: FimB/Mfa2 family fimbrial subunit [Tannerellaceae bacterium]
MKRYPKYLLLSVIVLISSMFSCTKESLKLCEPGLELTYIYELNKYYTNRFSEEVTKLTIYVFDSNERFYRSYVVDRPGDYKSIHLPLPEGEWHLLSWGGLLNTYNVGELDSLVNQSVDLTGGLIVGQTSLESFSLLVGYDLIFPSNPYVVGVKKIIDDLYYGDYIKVNTYNDRVVTQTIPMMKNTQQVYLKMNAFFLSKSDNVLSTSDSVNIYAIVRNGRYRFDNFIDNVPPDILYLNDLHLDGDTLVSSQKLLRLMIEDEDGVLCIESDYLPNGKLEIPIVESILKHPDYNTQEDLDREDVYEFRIDIAADLNVTVNINGWEFVSVVPEL